MTQTRILILSTYPYDQPRHGGQVRLSSIDRSYREAGFQIDHVCVYEPEVYTPGTKSALNIAFGQESPHRQYHGDFVPFILDYLSGAFASSDDGAWRQIKAGLSQIPQVIHLEQPWLLPLAERLLAEPGWQDTRLVYGSQNIEVPLKRAILEKYKIDRPDVMREIVTLEARTVQRADLVLGLSEADCAVLRGMTSKPVLLCANGIDPWQSTEAARKRWAARCGSQPFALFVASAHPPNFTGFFDCLGDSLAFLPPDRKIVAAGSVGPAIQTQAEFLRYAPLNASRILVTGMLPDEDLAALKDLAQSFILPITIGAGSNIKTAEALYSGKFVIGTTVSFRGFEAWLDLPGVTVADTPADFRAALTRSLDQPLPADAASYAAKRRGLTWRATLEPLAAAVATLAKSPVAA